MENGSAHVESVASAENELSTATVARTNEETEYRRSEFESGVTDHSPPKWRCAVATEPEGRARLGIAGHTKVCSTEEVFW